MKIKAYRIIGIVLSIYGVVGYLAHLCQPDKFQRFIANPQADFMPALYGSLTSFAFNPFLWLGLFFLWRVDKNLKPAEKSKWLRIIKVYAVYTAAMFVMALILILAPRLK